MLYDPKWEQQTRADPFSLESLITWLERQGPRQTYRFDQPAVCLVGQWIRAMGLVAEKDVGRISANLVTARSVFAPIVFRRPQTFAAALRRARAQRPLQERIRIWWASLTKGKRT